jgi:hypothetical protein
MGARGFRLAIGFLLAGIDLALAGTKNAPVIIDLHAHRGEIRAELVKHTPVGSSAKEVTDFISKRLQLTDGNSAVMVEPVKNDPQGRVAKRIRIYLGQYYDHPEVVFLSTPLVMQREVTAKWLFDSHDRLVDVVVEKQNGVY